MDSIDIAERKCIQLIVDNLEGYALARLPHPQYLDRDDLQPTEEVAKQLLRQILQIVVKELVDGEQ